MAQDKKDWEIYPERYVTNEDGSFVLKKDGTPKKKSGRPQGSSSQYNYHSSTKAKMQARRAVSKQKKDIKNLTNKLNTKKSKLKTKEEVFKKLDNISNNKVVEEDILKDLPQSVREHLKSTDQDIVFKANEGPQTDFLAAGELDVLYGGAAGGGKSYAMLVDPLRYLIAY